LANTLKNTQGKENTSNYLRDTKIHIWLLCIVQLDK